MSKYVIKNGRLAASDDFAEVGAGSYLISSIIADIYNDYIPEYVSGKLLDLGCGRIPLYALYKDHIDDCVCIDWVNSAHHNENLDIEANISEPLPLENGSFDSIICSDVLEHIFNPVSVLDEMVRVCKTGGYIIVNTPFNYWIHEEPYDYNRYTPYFYEKYAETRDDIELVDLRTMGGTGPVLIDMIGKKLQGKLPHLVRWIQKQSFKGYKTKKVKGWTLGVAAVFKKI
ncbi:MAG: class I SAM-dependent methyltransferase [Lachnospiraceae bacterium]|nr:class I SAM-dependent methyltransferase [Lachnospiraceae bacterium]